MAGREANLSGSLRSLTIGQTVEIITDAGVQFNAACLKFVVSVKAIEKYCQILNDLNCEDSVCLGRHLLNDALVGIGTLVDVSPKISTTHSIE